MTTEELNLQEILLWKARTWQREGITFSEEETAHNLRQSLGRPVPESVMNEVLGKLGFI